MQTLELQSQHLICVHLTANFEKYLFITVATNLSSMVIGVSLSTNFTRAVGNKLSILISNVIWICGWICLSIAEHFYFFILGCFLIGFSTGFGNKLAIYYLIEMPQRELRGIISVLNSACFAAGQMLGHLATIILPWRRGIQMCGVIPFLAILFLKFVPELPNYLLTKDKLEQAEKNFFLLRGVSQESETEFASMVAKTKDILDGRKRSIFKIICSRKFLMPFFVSTTLFTAQSTSAIDCLVIYMVDILTKMSPTIDAKLVTILFDSLCVTFCILSCYLVKKFKRRELLLTGAVGTIITMILLILNMHFELPVYLLIIFLCIYNATVNLGVVPVVWLVPAEVSLQFHPTLLYVFIIFLYDIGSHLSFLLLTFDQWKLENILKMWM